MFLYIPQVLAIIAPPPPPPPPPTIFYSTYFVMFYFIDVVSTIANMIEKIHYSDVTWAAWCLK